MPVYVRKTQESIAPSDFTEVESNDSDYMLNPDDFRDLLPQPYKLVDKILDEVLERCFERITVLEAELSIEKSRALPSIAPIDLCQQVADISNIRYLVDSLDERFVFCGTTNGLIALDAITMKSVATYPCDNKYEIIHIKVSLFGPKVYLLCTIDDYGLARLFMFNGSAFYLAKVLNDDEGDKRLLCLQLDISPDGDYLTATLQNVSNQSVWLEVHKIPKDTWVKEFEQQASGETISTSKKQTKIVEEGTVTENEEPTVSGDDNAEVTTLKLTASIIVLRVKPPVSMSAASATLSYKNIDTSGDVIGNGYNHLLTQGHIQMRDNIFKHLHADKIKFLSNISQPFPAIPRVLFLTNGRNLSFGLEQNYDKIKLCVAVAVSWNGDHRVQTYSLLRSGKVTIVTNLVEDNAESKEAAPAKTTKGRKSVLKSKPASTPRPTKNYEDGDDSTSIRTPLTSARKRQSRPTSVATSRGVSFPFAKVEFKPDYVWTFSFPVTSLSISPCASLISVGLESGSLVIHDKYLGINLHTLNIEPQAIMDIIFLNPVPSVGSTSGDFFGKKSAVNVVVVLKNYTCYTVNVASNQMPKPVKMVTSARHSHETPVQLCYPRIHPDLLFRVSTSGYICLYDVTLSKEVLQFQLPAPYELPSPWEKGVWCLAGCGQTLYMRAFNSETSEDDLYCYNLKILIPMRGYWSKFRDEVSYRKPEYLEDYVNNSLTERVASHEKRQKDLKTVWSNLLQTFEEVQKLSDISDTPNSFRTLDTAMSQRSGNSEYERINKFLQQTQANA